MGYDDRSLIIKALYGVIVVERGQHTEYEMKLRNSIANNLRSLLKKRNMTQKALSELTGIPTSTISDYLNTKSLAIPGNVQKMADALNVNKSDIDPSFGPPSTPKEMINLPIVGKISCGNGAVVFEEVEGYEVTPKEWAAGGEYFYLRARGDSMAGARIHEGDLLLIRRQEEVEDGEIAAILINDEARLKRVYRRDNALILQSENPNYPPIVFNKEDNNNIRIIGKLKKIVINF